MSIAIKFNYRI